MNFVYVYVKVLCSVCVDAESGIDWDWNHVIWLDLQNYIIEIYSFHSNQKKKH